MQDSLTPALLSAWAWPSPEAGFAKLVIASMSSPPVPLGALSFAEADLHHLDRAPLLASAGYAYSLDETRAQLHVAWASGLARLSERDAFPSDRRSFAFEPLELLGISLGAIKCPAVDSASLRWLRHSAQQLESHLQLRDTWQWLISYWAAYILGVSWRPRALAPQSGWAQEDIALANWLSGHQPEIATAHGIVPSDRFEHTTPQEATKFSKIRDPARAALLLYNAFPRNKDSQNSRTMSTSRDLTAIRIGIATALPEEFAAVRAMLDDPFEVPTRKHEDPHPYVTGWIPAPDGRHLIAITLAPKMANNSAASMAAHLIRTFPTIRDVLMVGIAGGVPNPDNVDSHVRVGDVVVSNEYGVVQYDNIKIGRGKPEVRDTSSPPAAWLVAKIKYLESLRLSGERPWEKWIERGKSLENAQRPPEEDDVLVDKKNQPISHPPDVRRVLGQPKIHYGRIASANILLKRPSLREALRRDHKARAVEMEGSGIADGTWETGRGYLLIRGICDYCDQKKNDKWHGYAAVVAAAYAAAVLASTNVGELTPATQSLDCENA